MSTSLALPEKQAAAVSKLETRALAVYNQAIEVTIESDEAAVSAQAFLNDVINPLIREGDELFDPLIESANHTHKLAIATKKKAVGNLPLAKDFIRKLLGGWAMVQEERARQARLEAERVAREAEERRIEAEIAAIEAAGGPEAEADIAAVLEAPRADVMLPPEAFVVPRMAGARDVYSAEVIRPREFFAAVGDGRVPVSLALVNQAALNRRAAADREGFNVPGCRLIKSKSVVSRRA